MQINTDSLVSITEANQNFSKVARLVDTNGIAIILKNNTPRYVLLEYSQFQNDEFADNATVQELGQNIVKRHFSTFNGLAK
ncbi:type II toxin-antitoxin system Phd/YefM family antitoxin [Aminipila butyrica]|uniref:Antitoxin n=1 Tax=Aminipila butyrica TaxID=433296 RepID=A0A858BU09_9FIRM|nr:type II toxin-antitoxin system Phd/YefM family antitoxin [Aminipila butyrica]QIB69511.1 type II toxin-antitoxin system Phd/YefM family antitoxin [Aminipila butyrica]